MSSSKELRAKARTALSGNIFSRNWLMALVIVLIHTFALRIIDLAVLGIGSLLLCSFFTFGYAAVFLPILRGQQEKVEIKDYFKGFDNFGGLVVLSLMTNLFVFLWSLLFLIPGIVKSYSYAMAPYIKYDHPEYGWKRCLDESKAMMKGYKWKLFCLELSFIGWNIVGMLCFMVGIYWVTPYSHAAHVAFYDELKKVNG